MITNLLQAHEDFFALISTSVVAETQRVIEIEVDSVSIAVPVHYYKRSSQNFAEGMHVDYPQVIIQDYAPEDDMQRWSVSGEQTVLRRYDTDGDGVNDTADVIGDPTLLKFRYDVSQVSKDFIQSSELYTWFLKKFPRWGFFPIADEVCRVNRKSNEVFRSDGVYEFNHAFEVEVWFVGNVQEQVPLVTSILLNLNQKNNG